MHVALCCLSWSTFVSASWPLSGERWHYGDFSRSSAHKASASTTLPRRVDYKVVWGVIYVVNTLDIQEVHHVNRLGYFFPKYKSFLEKVKGKSDSFKVCLNAFRSKNKNSEVCILKESMSVMKEPHLALWNMERNYLQLFLFISQWLNVFPFL